MIAIPIGARVLVKDLDPEVSLVARAAKAGLFAVVQEENVPKPTSGKVIAVGSDPLIQELVSIGDVVIFGRNSGTFVQIEGVEYRSLFLNEIITAVKPTPVEPETVLEPEVLAQESVGSDSRLNSPSQDQASSTPQPPR